MTTIIEGIMWDFYYEYILAHTHANRVNILCDWLNNPSSFNRRMDCMNDLKGLDVYYSYLLK